VRTTWTQLAVLTLALGAGVACDDHLFPISEGGGTTPTDAEGWCAVKPLLTANCVACHQTDGVSIPWLDADPHGALVGVESPNYGIPYVVPGDPDASLLVQKLEGAAGGIMPPGGMLAADRIAAVRQWITDGATEECAGGTTTTVTVESYHRDPDWEQPQVHGMSAKFQTESCGTAACHGEDLQGGSTGISCESCHGAGWETTCTFCHGEGDAGDPLAWAPPENIDDSDALAALATFPAHPVHLASPLHATWDCAQCHQTPGSVFDPGHVLFGDTTPGRAEVRFTEADTTGGAGTFDPGATRADPDSCTVYCHGTGRYQGAEPVLGTVSADASLSCDGCHPDWTSGENAWDRMSGEHEKHLGEGLQCAECHAGTVNLDREIVGPTLHLNLSADVALAPRSGSMSSGDGLTCNGTCHGQRHVACDWVRGECANDD
jgi:hypothetical protein